MSAGDATDDPPPPRRPRGIVCPACLGRLRVVGTKRPKSGLKIRYVKCEACGHRDRTKEELLGPAKRPPAK